MLENRFAVSRSLVLVLVLIGIGPAACTTMAPVDSDADVDAATVDAATSDGETSECVAIARTCAEVRASFISSSTSVSVTCDETAGTFTVRSTGVPNYDSNQTTPNTIREQGWIVTLPLQPSCAARPTDVINSRGAIGFMINGVPFYGPQDATGRDAVIFEGPTFDDCEGHADQSCSYHYHAEPICVFGQRDTSAMHRLADGHPPVVGYALDGFALYASDDRAGAATDLDSCNGHTDAVRGYHYHSTAVSPYLVGCLRGTRTGQVTQTMSLCSAGDGGVMPPGDGGTMGPRACTTSAECNGACPPGSMGCTCSPNPMTGGSACVPTCASDTDCPAGPMGQLRCDPVMHICHP